MVIGRQFEGSLIRGFDNLILTLTLNPNPNPYPNIILTLTLTQGLSTVRT